MKITSFSGEYHFLSNFYPCQVKLDGEIYDSVEHAYQAAKTLSPELRQAFRKPSMTAGASKKMGRSLEIREDWDEVKLQVMEDLLVQKFAISDLKEKLLQTKDDKLIENNYWHDNVWGSCTCKKCKDKGANNLGRLLMKIRQTIK